MIIVTPWQAVTEAATEAAVAAVAVHLVLWSGCIFTKMDFLLLEAPDEQFFHT